MDWQSGDMSSDIEDRRGDSGSGGGGGGFGFGGGGGLGIVGFLVRQGITFWERSSMEELRHNRYSGGLLLKPQRGKIATPI
jgi:predicted metalloprotease